MFSSLIPGLRPPKPSPSPASVTSATADGTSITPSSSSATASPTPTVTGTGSASSPCLPSTNNTPASSVSPHPGPGALLAAVGGGGPPRSASRATTTTSTTTSLGPSMALSSQRQIDEARNAVVASIGNMLDRELQGRAALLHANNAAIEKQERDVSRARDALRRENDKLARLATDHTRKVKEIGNVQNWAEMLEREFLIVEETLRLVREGSDEDEEGSWSGSECPSDCDCGRERRREVETDGEGDVVMGNGVNGKGKGRDDGVLEEINEGVLVAPEMIPIPDSPQLRAFDVPGTEPVRE